MIEGKLQLCVDYSALNKAILNNGYPAPLISEMLDRLYAVPINTKLFFSNAHHLVRINIGDKYVITFHTRDQQLEHRVMPFRLTNAPGTFQPYFNDYIKCYTDNFAVDYFDDILIHASIRWSMICSYESCSNDHLNWISMETRRCAVLDSQRSACLDLSFASIGLQWNWTT